MLKSWMAPAAAAFAVLLLAGTVDTAEAKKSGGWSGGGAKFSGGGGKFYGGKVYGGGGKVYYGGTKFYGGNVYSGNKHARFHHRHRFVGVPLAYGYYGYSSGCSWLRHRAEVTGSSYWWNRYYACRDGYYYD